MEHLVIKMYSPKLHIETPLIENFDILIHNFNNVKHLLVPAP